MRFEAVLFDCDGVLVDSEPIVYRVLRAMLAERGRALGEEECLAHLRRQDGEGRKGAH